MDEFDIEVTPIGARALTDAPHADDPLAPSPMTVDAASVAPFESPRRRSSRRRLRMLAVTVALVAALVAMLWVPTGTRAVFTQFAARPTPTRTTAPLAGSDRFLWEHTVPWGTLLVDGRPGPDVRAAVATFDASGMLQTPDFRLPRGRHTLEYRAAPFPTLHCTVSVPRATADSCPLDFQNTDWYIMDTPGIRVLDLQATPNRLPREQAQTVATLTHAALDAAALAEGGDVIAPGDHLLGADGQPQVATTEWRGWPSVDIGGSAGVLDRPGEFTPCTPLCTSTSLFASSAGSSAWAVYAAVTLTWRYLLPNGAVALDNGPAVAAEAQVRVVTEMAVHWQNNHWQVDIAAAAGRLDPVICSVGAHALDVLRSSPNESTVNDPYAQWASAPLSGGLGCLYTQSTSGQTGATRVTVTPGVSARVFYRFGALVAVNTVAQHMFPHLPHPSAHERALAEAVSG